MPQDSDFRINRIDPEQHGQWRARPEAQLQAGAGAARPKASAGD